MNKKITVAVVVLTLLATGIATTSSVFAQSIAPNKPMNSLVQKIAAKFGLKSEEVQAVFDQEKTERKTQMEEQYLERLT